MKVFFITLLTFVTSLVSFASVETYYMSSSFTSPDGSYVEYYMITLGNSIEFVKNDAGNYQGEIEVTMIFKIKDSIVTFNKYNLLSPEVSQEDYDNESFPNFIDVQRIPIDDGVYDVELLVKDKNFDDSEIGYRDKLIVDFPDNKISFSDFELVERIEKSKTESIISRGESHVFPYVSDYYPENMSNLYFYLEMYNTDKFIGEPFILRYYIERFESANEIPEFSKFKKIEPASVVPIIGALNIEKLYSGNYFLVAEIKNKENEVLLKTKQFFQRNNPNEQLLKDLAEQVKQMDIGRIFDGELNNIDSIREYISCLHPIANIDEKTFINIKTKKSNIDELQGFFVSFWLKRNPATSGEDWREYKTQVEFINRHYGTPLRKGYATERGRVYLQYGAPNDIYVSRHEPHSFPYEIWTYHRVAHENNRKFIFYNRNLAGEEFELLHSDLTGELKTPNWEVILKSRTETQGNYDFNAPEINDTWGSRSKRIYNTK